MKSDKDMGMDIHQAMTVGRGSGCRWQGDSGNDGSDGRIMLSFEDSAIRNAGFSGDVGEKEADEMNGQEQIVAWIENRRDQMNNENKQMAHGQSYQCLNAGIPGADLEFATHTRRVGPYHLVKFPVTSLVTGLFAFNYDWALLKSSLRS